MARLDRYSRLLLTAKVLVLECIGVYHGEATPQRLFLNIYAIEPMVPHRRVLRRRAILKMIIILVKLFVNSSSI